VKREPAELRTPVLKNKQLTKSGNYDYALDKTGAAYHSMLS
jgi:hypothetical protein